MCLECENIDRKIAHFIDIRSAATDPLAIELLAVTIEQFETEKEALHSDPAGHTSFSPI